MLFGLAFERRQLPQPAELSPRGLPFDRPGPAAALRPLSPVAVRRRCRARRRRYDALKILSTASQSIP